MDSLLVIPYSYDSKDCCIHMINTDSQLLEPGVKTCQLHIYCTL
jgi:hypothetical protein